MIPKTDRNRRLKAAPSGGRPCGGMAEPGAGLVDIMPVAVPARRRSEVPGRAEVNMRTTVTSPGAVATELPHSVTDPESAERIRKFYAQIAIPADSFARAVAVAISQPRTWTWTRSCFAPRAKSCERLWLPTVR